MRAFCVLAILLALAACDTGPDPAEALLEGDWVARDSVVIMTGSGQVQGFLDQRYTFDVRESRVTGTLSVQTLDASGGVVRESTSSLEGTYTPPDVTFRILGGPSPPSVMGTVSETRLELYEEGPGGARIPYSVLRRP